MKGIKSFFSPQFKNSDLQAFFLCLHRYVKAGFSVEKALQALALPGKSLMSRLAQTCLKHVKEGRALSDCFRMIFKKPAHKNVLNLFQAMEDLQDPAEAFRLSFDYLKQEAAARRKMVGALRYPVCALFFVMTAGVFLQYQQSFIVLQSEGIASNQVASTCFFVPYLYFSFGLGVLGAACFMVTRRTRWADKIYRALMGDHFFGVFFSGQSAAFFFYILALGTEKKLAFDRIISLAQPVLNSGYLRRQANQARLAVISGKKPEEYLEAVALRSSLAAPFVQAAGQGVQPGLFYREVSQYFLQEHENCTDKLQVYLPAVVFILMGIGLGYFALSFFEVLYLPLKEVGGLHGL